MIKSETGFGKFAFISIMVILGFLAGGCNLNSDLTIDYVEANARFIARDGITKVGLWVRLKNDNSHKGNIKYWSFTIKEGGEVLLVINKDNYQDILGDSLHHFTDYDIINQGSVYLDNWSQNYCRPYFGDLFNGRNPDQVEVAIDIINGDEYRLTGSYAFTMTRE